MTKGDLSLAPSLLYMRVVPPSCCQVLVWGGRQYNAKDALQREESVDSFWGNKLAETYVLFVVAQRGEYASVCIQTSH